MKEKRLIYQGIDRPEAVTELSEHDKMLAKVGNANEKVRKYGVNQEKEKNYGIALNSKDLAMIADVLEGKPRKLARTLKIREARYNRLHFKKEKYGQYQIPGDVAYYMDQYSQGDAKRKADAVKSLVIMTLGLKGPSRAKMSQYVKDKGLEKRKTAKRYHEVITGKRVEVWGKKPKKVQLKADIARITEVVLKYNSEGLVYKGLRLNGAAFTKIRAEVLKRVLPKDLQVNGKKFLSPIERGLSENVLKKHFEVVVEDYYQANKPAPKPKPKPKPPEKVEKVVERVAPETMKIKGLLEGLKDAYVKKGAEGLEVKLGKAETLDKVSIEQNGKELVAVAVVSPAVYVLVVGSSQTEIRGEQKIVERVTRLLRAGKKSRVEIDPKRAEEIEARENMPRPYMKKAVEVGPLDSMTKFVDQLFVDMYPKGNEPGIRGRRFFSFDSDVSEEAYKMAVDVFKEKGEYKIEVMLFHGSEHEKVFRWEHPRFGLGSLVALKKHKYIKARKQFVADFRNWLKDNVKFGDVSDDLKDKGVKREDITVPVAEALEAMK
jgi:hypothetical protein